MSIALLNGQRRRKGVRNVPRFKFFSDKYMHKGHIEAIKKSRRVLMSDKVIRYDDDLFFEHYQYETPLYVVPKDDVIIKELENIEIAEDGSYNFSALSTEFKKYLRIIDDYWFDKSYHEWKNSMNDRWLDERIGISEVRLERELFEEELELIINGKIIKNEKSVAFKARDSARKAYKTVLELIRANLTSFESFITLTFARKEHVNKYVENGTKFELIDDVQDFDLVKKSFVKFINTLQKNMRRKDIEFEYIAVYERHRDGAYHFHLVSTLIPDEYLTDCPEWLDYDFKTKKRRNGKMLGHWKYGKSDVEIIRDKERMSTYLSKYIAKSFENLTDSEENYEKYLNQKKYFASRGLKRPTVEYVPANEDNKKEIITKKKAEYSDKYSTSYKNVYSDSMIEKTICSKIEFINNIS